MFNVKFLILNYLLITLLFSYEANSITKQELQQLKKIDEQIYKLSSNKDDEKEDNSLEVIHFIYRNLRYDLDYSKLKITTNANVKSSTTQNSSYENQTTQDKTSGNIMLSLTYPLYDKKEEKQREQEIIKLKNQIAKDVTDYFTLKFEYEELKSENKILKLIETRDKARKLNGMGSFSDWLNTVKSLKKNKYDMKYKHLELIQKKQTLLNYIKLNEINNLENLLK